MELLGAFDFNFIVSQHKLHLLKGHRLNGRKDHQAQNGQILKQRRYRNYGGIALLDGKNSQSKNGVPRLPQEKG